MLDHLTPDMFLRAFVNGWVVDARPGGLVVGRLHSEGHILMYRPSNPLGQHDHLGRMQGGEYILNAMATERFFKRIEEINRDNAPTDLRPNLTINSRIINTHAEPHDKIVIVDSQWIVNANATNRHFEELEWMNSQFPTCNGRLLSDGQIATLMQIPI